jgi:hypothetical protein
VRLVIDQIDRPTTGEAPHLMLQPKLVIRSTT